MHNTLRKIFTSALVVATIVTTSGILSVNTVKAAAPDMSLIKMAGLSTVYYLKDGKRYVFPNQKTFLTWYRDFSSVITVSQSELESYPLGGNVTYRPGVKLVKITTDPKVYAVDNNRTLRSIVSEANAISLWGSNWASKVEDVPDSFFTNYIVGAPLTAGMYGAGQLAMHSGNPDVYYFNGSQWQKFGSEVAFTGNRFSFMHVATAPASVNFTPLGSEITGVDNSLINTAGSASSSVSTGTGLSVALASDTPASASVPLGATGVNYTKFNVTASNDGDIILQSVTVTRMGVGTPSDFENVYLYDGMTRLTTGRSINSSTNKATFNNLNMTIARGTTKTLWIAADMSASGTGSGSSSLGIASASDVVAGGATVTGSFPVSGNMMGMTNVQAGSIVIEKTGTLSNPKAGETGAKIASFKLTAGSAEDLKVTGITLYNSGNVQSDKLSNFVLKQAGTTVATAAAMSSSSQIMLNFTSPFTLEKGASRTFELYGDISATARANDTISLYLDNSADLHTVGQTYGFGAAVNRTAYDGGADASSTTIQAGQVTLSFQGPAVQDLAVQQQDVELFRFTITAQSNIEIRNTRLNMTAAGGSNDNDLTDAEGLLNLTVPNYTDIKFTDVTSNQLVAGPKDVTASGNDLTQTLTYTDTWNVNAGQTRTIKVTSDIANYTPAADETIKATLNTFTAGTDIKNLDTNQFLGASDIVPSTNIAGNTHRVKAGTATATLAGTPSLQTYINGSSAVSMTGVNITAGTGKDLRVTSLKLTATGANSCGTETDCVLNVKLWDGATQVGQTKSLLSDGTQPGATSSVTFDNLNVMVSKGTTKTLTASVDLNTLSTVAGGTTLHLDVAANATDIVAQDADGNSVSVTAGSVVGPSHVIVAAGSMTADLAPDDTESEARLVLAGNNDEVLGKFKFTASREALKISKVRVEVPAAAIEEVMSVSLWDGATKVTNDVTLSSGTPNYADFNSFTTDFIVPKDGSKTLTVKANLQSTSNGATSGTLITATLSTTAGTFEARGTNSNTVLTNADVTLGQVGNNMYLRKTKMTITEDNLTTTAISNGTENEVYKFTVAADAKEDVAIKQLAFSMTLTDNGTGQTLTATGLKLYRGNTDISGNVFIHNLDGTLATTVGENGGTANVVVVTWVAEEVISKGTSNSYTLRATLGGYTVGTEDDSFRVVLNNDSAVQNSAHVYLRDLDLDATAGSGSTTTNKTATLGAQAVGTANFSGTAATAAAVTLGAQIIWSDNSVVGHASTLADSTDTGGGNAAVSTSSGDWANSFLIKNLPFTGRTMTN